MTAAVVLAGGAGRRMGGPKASVAVPGGTLAGRAVAIARAAGCDPVLVVARPRTPLPPLDGAALVHDPPGDTGPLGAIACGLAALDDHHDDVLVLACDLPNAAAVAARLVASPAGQAFVAVDPAGRLQPLCARYPRARALVAASAALAAGERRVRVLCDALDANLVRAVEAELLNVNEPADLDRVAASPLE